MSKIFGEVIHTPNGETLYAAVVRTSTTELTRVPVQSNAEGEKIILELLTKLEEFAIAEGDKQH
jgi:hypothetical protein